MMVYERAVAHFGAGKQTEKAVEELTELSLALQRALEGRADNDNILEEMADVSIMLEQLRVIFGDYDDWKAKKLARIEDRMNVEYGLALYLAAPEHYLSDKERMK